MNAQPNLIGDMMFSNGSLDAMEEGTPEVNHSMEENPRVKQLATKERYAFDEQGKPHSKIKILRSGMLFLKPS